MRQNVRMCVLFFSMCMHACVCVYSYTLCVCVCMCLLFCIPTPRGVKGEMGETCYCFTSHTSLTHRRGTHLTTDTTPDGMKHEEVVEKQWSIPARTKVNTKRDRFECLLFGILLEIEDVGGGGGDGGHERWVHRIIIHRQNKSCVSLSICLSVLLWCDLFHLLCFQGWSESKTRRLPCRPKSCIYSDLITKTQKIQCDAASLTGTQELAIKTYKCIPL